MKLSLSAPYTAIAVVSNLKTDNSDKGRKVKKVKTNTMHDV